MVEIERGWQPDDQTPGLFRWHDGEKWTDHTSQVDPSNPPREGWYPDPDDPTTDMMRYWNGKRWTKKRAPLDPKITVSKKLAEEQREVERLSTAKLARFKTIKWGLNWLFPLGGVLLLLVLALFLLLRPGGDDEETTAAETKSATPDCVAAEFDLAPGAPDPCAPSPTGETATATSPPSETTNATSSPTGACTPRTFKGTIDGSVAGRGAPSREHYELVDLAINPDCSLSALLVWVAEYPDGVTASNPDGIWCAAFIGEDFNMKVEMTGENSGTATGRLSANVEGPLGHCPEVDYPTNPTGIGSYLRQAGQDATFNLNGDTLTGNFTDTYERFTVTFTATEQS